MRIVLHENKSLFFCLLVMILVLFAAVTGMHFFWTNRLQLHERQNARQIAMKQEQLEQAYGIIRKNHDRTESLRNQIKSLQKENMKWKRGRSTAEDFSHQNTSWLGKFDPASIISIKDVASAEKKEDNLVHFIFGKSGLPKEIRDLSGKRLDNSPYLEPFKDIADVYQVRLQMALGFTSTYWRIIPHEERDCLLLFHQGHALNLFDNGGQDTIRRFAEKGCRVVAFQMPDMAENKTRPLINDPRLGFFRIAGHDQFDLLQKSDGSMEGAEGSPIRFFLEPLTLALNYETSTRGFSKIGMTGISGGGWTTTVYSAIDQRIQASYPVAGSYPVYLHNVAKGSSGDWEQNHGGLLRTANYLEMYILGSFGNNRKQIQILNRNDSCCFGGDYFHHYENTVSEIANGIGGRFSVFSDPSHREHKISGVALDWMIQDFLESGP